MKQNLDKLDRILRFLLAFWWLGPFAPKISIIWVNWLILFIGLIALVESFIGYCWLHDLFGISHKN